METPYDRLYDLREATKARQQAELAKANRAREAALHQVIVAKNAACWEIPDETEVALWQVADAAKARSLILLHQAEEKLRAKDAELATAEFAATVAMREEKIVARMKERFAQTRRETARRHEEREVDDFNATKLFLTNSAG